MKSKHTCRKICKGAGILLLVIVVLAGSFVAFLSLREYNPDAQSPAEHGLVALDNALSKDNFRILTLNTGYGGLGKDSDFFMDGGEGVTPKSKELVQTNMNGIREILQSADADIVFLQEVDTDSKRSYGLNQWEFYAQALNNYESHFALNYSCDYVPYPFPDTIGKVHSGVATFANVQLRDATRYALPCPFSWPMRVANLKRCLLVTRVSIADCEQELVLVNFHLEAYDDGEGKEEQTKQLLKFIEDEYAKGNYVIAGGDFNQNFPGAEDAYPMKPTSEWQPGELTTLPEGWTYAYDATVPTCRLLNQPLNESSDLTQYYVIDGFITSPNLQVNNVKTLNESFTYTDHSPVIMDVSLIP